MRPLPPSGIGSPNMALNAGGGEGREVLPILMVVGRVHETELTEAGEIEQHDAAADAVRVVPVWGVLFWVRGHGDRDPGLEGIEVCPELRRVGDEEGVGVNEDGTLDSRR